MRITPQLLKERTALKLFVVGHTDMTASLEHNRTLSAARAQAVVKALVTNYGIATARLEGHGVGPLAPAALNANAGAGPKIVASSWWRDKDITEP